LKSTVQQAGNKAVLSDILHPSSMRNKITKFISEVIWWWRWWWCKQTFIYSFFL